MLLSEAFSSSSGRALRSSRKGSKEIAQVLPERQVQEAKERNPPFVTPEPDPAAPANVLRNSSGGREEREVQAVEGSPEEVSGSRVPVRPTARTMMKKQMRMTEERAKRATGETSFRFQARYSFQTRGSCSRTRGARSKAVATPAGRA
jgi:hypothetical protein